MADQNDETRTNEEIAEEQTDANEQVEDLQPKKDVKGGSPPRQ